MATIWKGSVSFGLVTIPVELRSAVRSEHVSFRLLHEEDLSPVRYERVCERTGEPVPWSEIVKGYEYAKGKYVVITDEDFRAAALDASKSIDILDFVQAEEIDARWFETPYYLVPGKGGEKAYALLREALRATGAVGIGKIVLRQTQHLGSVRVVGDALVLTLMRFSAELVDEGTLSLPSSDLVRPQELAMAEQLVRNLAAPFDPERYTDDYRANLMKVVKAKLRGKKVELEQPEPDAGDTQVIDLMSRLRASLEAKGKGGRRAAGKRARGASRSESRGGARNGSESAARGAARSAARSGARSGAKRAVRAAPAAKSAAAKRKRTA
jgi:DNA end-binding protein Ku